MTPQEAYELVHLKWTRIIKKLEAGKGSVNEIYIQVCKQKAFRGLLCGCAYCEIFNCANCPLGGRRGSCCITYHPFHKFQNAYYRNDTPAALIAAKKLLELIEKTKP